MNEKENNIKTKIAGWAGTNFSYSKVVNPINTNEVKDIIEKAKRDGNKIIARGAGSSYGDVALNQDNIVINTRDMREVINWDKKKGILKVEPGIMYSEILPKVLKDKWTLPIIPGTRYVTLGGALANNIHGKNSFKKGNFGEHVLEFKIIVASSEEITCSKDTNADLFFGAIGGAGLLGIVTEITLQLVRIPSPFLVVQKTIAPNLNELIDYLEKSEINNEFMIAQVDCFQNSHELGRGTIHTASFTSVDFDYKDKFEYFSKISKKMFNFIPKKWIISLGSYFLNNFTMQLISATKYYLDKITSSKKSTIQNLFAFTFLLDNLPGWKKVFKEGFFEYEPLIPKEKVREVIPKLIALTHKYKMPAYLSAIKIHRKDDFLLSYSLNGYSFAMDIPRKPKFLVKQRELFKKMNEIVIKEGGKIYLAKDAILDREDFKEMYENIPKFLELKNKYDPEEIFQSDMYRRIFK